MLGVILDFSILLEDVRVQFFFGPPLQKMPLSMEVLWTQIPNFRDHTSTLTQTR